MVTFIAIDKNFVEQIFVSRSSQSLRRLPNQFDCFCLVVFSVIHIISHIHIRYVFNWVSSAMTAEVGRIVTCIFVIRNRAILASCCIYASACFFPFYESFFTCLCWKFCIPSTSQKVWANWTWKWIRNIFSVHASPCRLSSCAPFRRLSHVRKVRYHRSHILCIYDVSIQHKSKVDQYLKIRRSFHIAMSALRLF